jgi:hypothetical protein
VAFGFDARSVQELREPGRERQIEPQADLESDVLRRLTEFDATFAVREARAVALEAAAELGVEQGLGVLAQLHERGEVLDLADGRQTTRAHRALERRTVQRAAELARGRVEVLDGRLIDAEVQTLATELAKHKAAISGEQERAIRAACGDRQLVVVVGQAGTGKSTALLGAARAHQQAGQRVIVTSTGAQAAERLAGELRDGGVDARGHSTTALRVNVEQQRLELGPGVTVIHDEAALASTREQEWLLRAAVASGARLVEVGDPRQSQAVGAGGLWPAIEDAARDQDALVELSRIVRARDPADRRDQSLFRVGQHERALEGYAERGRVAFEPDRQHAEDRALEAAQVDRLAGKSTLVIAETSNEQIDALNARAQAIRAEHGELVAESVPVSRRPYGLHAGDEVVVRAPVRDEQVGPVRNGTRALVIDVDGERERAMLRLDDGRETSWDRELIDAGQVRLAYVQHPFPAQGVTTDTAHLIAGPLSTAEGSYVGLTRAREMTRVYAAADQLDLAPDAGREQAVRALGEWLGRGEPEMPSIRIPLAHEQSVEREHEQQTLPIEIEHDDSLVALRAERDRLRALLDTFPSDAAASVARLEQQEEEARRSREQADERAERYRVELEQMSRRERRGELGQTVQVRASSERAIAQRARDAEHDTRAEVEQIQAGERSPARWEAEHPGAREQLEHAENVFDRTVEREAARAIEAPGEHLVRVLGERPAAERGAEREAWDGAARAVEGYRIAHEIDPTEPTALGVEPEIGRESWERQQRWREAAERVLDARKQLEISEPGLGPLGERLARVPGIAPERDLERHRERDLGREM